VDHGITYMLNKLGLDPQSETAKLLVEEFKGRVLPVKFCGTVHCEASLMGMIIACKDNMAPLPDGVKRKELEALKKVVMDDGVSAIGVGKKCCWCCASFAGILRVAHPRISFQVPASHGLLFPWALPTIGISLPVAESMENALKELWCREVGRYAEDFSRSLRKGIQSAMGSPAGSITYHAPDLFDSLFTEGSLP